jgi:hypothetical protein
MRRASGSGSDGARVLRRRRRPQTAFGARQRTQPGAASTTLGTAATCHERRRLRPQSAAHGKVSRRAHRRRPASASGPQFRFARLLQRQAELYKACNALAQRNRDLSAQIIKTEKAMAQHRAQTKQNSQKALVSARNATAQHRRL